MKLIDRFGKYAATLLFVLFGLWSCATPLEGPPDWITGVDAEHRDGRRFVAYGRDVDRVSASDAALRDAQRQVEQILLNRIDASERIVTETVAEQLPVVAARRAETLEVLDEFGRIDTQNNYEMYRLLLYRDTEQLLDIEALDAPSARDDGETDALTEDETALATIESIFSGAVPASAAEQSVVLNEALSIAGEVVVTAQPDEMSVPLGTDPSTVVQVDAFAESDPPRPIRDEPFVVEIVGPAVDGNRLVVERAFTTDDNGSFSFTPGEPRYSGATVLTAQPAWFGRDYDRWSDQITSDEARDLLDAIATRLQARTVLNVTTRATEIPTAVVVLDQDIAGNLMDGNDAMGGMFREFEERGFRVRNVDLTVAERERLVELDRISVADLYDIFPFDVLSSVDRAIVGDARMVDFNEDDGFRVGVEINVVAFDLRRDQRLARVQVTERISGSSAQTTIRAAFQEAGRRVARRLAPQLP